MRSKESVFNKKSKNIFLLVIYTALCLVSKNIIYFTTVFLFSTQFVIDPLSIDFVRRDYPLKPYKDIKLDTEGPVLRDMPLDSELEHIYVMTPYKVSEMS